ncbi:MAG: conjugal transfer protein TraX [Rhodocyclales bacterium]|nr:conjugal transfer protein TraX [Rhodocyclales bacterium]
MPRLVLADGTVEGLKWLAFALMLIDHANKYLLNWSVPWMFAVGRLAMPIFAVVLGYNMARFGVDDTRGLRRLLARLTLAAAIATVPFIALGKTLAGGWWPLNILAALATAVAVLLLWRSSFPLHRVTAVVVFLVGGALGEFFWPAIGIVLAACSYARAPNITALTIGITCTALLGPINGNAWALAGLVIVALATQVRLPVARWPRFFYVAYPAHLALLWLVLQVHRS